MKKLLLILLASLITAPAFAQKISSLSSATTPTGAEFMPMVQAGATVKVTPLQLLTYIAAQGITWSNPQTYSALVTMNGGLTVSTGNVGITSGNLSVGGTSTFSGLATASLGLNITAGGEVITAGGLSINGGGESITSGNLSVTNITSSGESFSGGTLVPTESTTSAGIYTGVQPGSTCPGINCFPSIDLIYPSGAAGQKIWSLVQNGAGLYGRIYNDTYTSFAQWITVLGSSTAIISVNFPSGAVEIAGNPRTFATLTNTGTACSITSSGNATQGVTNCTRNSTGDMTVSFSTTGAAPYNCVVAPWSGTAIIAVVYNATTTSASVRTFNTAGTATDSGVNINCN